MLRFRLHSSPVQSLLLNVRSAGHYRFVPGQIELRPPGDFLQMYWSVSGQGRIRAGGRNIPIRPGSLFLFHAGETHDLLADATTGWEFRWLTLDGEHSGNIAKIFRLRREQAAGPCPAHLFEELDACLRDPTSAGERRASVTAYEILMLASLGAAGAPKPRETDKADEEADVSTSPRPETAAAAKAWLEERFADPRLNVSVLAEKLRVHRASLHRAFVKSYGVAPVQYLGRLRLRLALELLASTRLSIAEVAARCGLPDSAYFSKLISRHTGFSPRVYRDRYKKTAAGSRPS